MGSEEDKRDPETYTIIGAAMRAHSELGSGFLESVYQQALTIEFQRSKVPFEQQKKLPVRYRGEKLDAYFQADFVCFDSVIVELKAIDQLGKPAEAQVINYLKASRLEKAILLNFGTSRLQYQRLILNQ